MDQELEFKVEKDVFEDLLTKMRTRDNLVNLLRYTEVYAIDLLKARLSVDEFKEFLTYIDHDIKLFEETFPNLKEEYKQGIRRKNVYEFSPYYFLQGLVKVHNRGLRNAELFKNKVALMGELALNGVPVLSVTDAFSGAVTLNDLTIIPYDTNEQLVADYKETELTTPYDKSIKDIESIINYLVTNKEVTRKETFNKLKVNSFLKAANTFYKTSKSSDEIHERLVNHNKELMDEFDEINPGVFYNLEAFKGIINLLVTERSDKDFYDSIENWLDNNYPNIHEELEDFVYVHEIRSYHDLLVELEELKRKYTVPHLYI